MKVTVKHTAKKKPSKLTYPCLLTYVSDEDSVEGLNVVLFISPTRGSLLTKDGFGPIETDWVHADDPDWQFFQGSINIRN